ncbi:hypothetical protein SAMN04489760_101103 [Syntrophus gentianae]|uniref:Uncharacterized protein n=1 Tax=Syntrophus gentianae TaxID=43775 RepID=A0A1H7UCF6_9BACT|nr:hypothetical protein SAMN04489760_101103 [Syntrophus gentianae]
MDFLYISPAFPSNDVLLILNPPGSGPGDVDLYELP